MSNTSKVVLGLACAASLGIILYVHLKQTFDKQKLHDGVIRDVERQQRRKIENLHFLQQQMEISKILKKQEIQEEAISLQLLEEAKRI